MCRKYRVPATLPFFIPFPKLNPFGTMGAVIQMRGPIPNKRALFDIAAAGPLASFFLSIPAIYFGMRMSHVVPIQSSYGGMLELGDSLLFKGISFLAVGHLADDVTLVLHPLSYAGWVGLFVTALNLLPIGQLDGGHVIYSIFGRDAQKVSYIFLVALGVLTIIYPGWGLLFVLLLFFGRRHPAPIDDYTPLDRKRRLLGIFILLIFITCFTPIPFKF
ncbi:MAG: site-2 protease family protein [Calditrichaeota bacterium]|nr:site-2 protease family protein [Calditrichota bacterium]